MTAIKEYQQVENFSYIHGQVNFLGWLNASIEILQDQMISLHNLMKSNKEDGSAYNKYLICLSISDVILSSLAKAYNKIEDKKSVTHEVTYSIYLLYYKMHNKLERMPIAIDYSEKLANWQGVYELIIGIREIVQGYYQSTITEEEDE